MAKLTKLNIRAALAVALMLSTAPLSHASFEDAVKAYEAGDYDTALKEWMVLADKDDPAAMRNIGHIYRLGLGREINYERAMHWYKRSSVLNFPNAQANVASMYLRGQGVDQDYVEASKWFTKAARNGHVISQYNLGLMYENGKGVEKSLSKALAWYNLAAKAGHPKALDKLSLLVATKPDVKVAREEETVKVVTTPEPAAKPQPAPVAEEKTSAPVAQKALPKQAAEPSKPAAQSQSDALKVAETEPVDRKPAASKPAGTSASSTPASALSPTKVAPEKPKFDPFAGSANNKSLSSEQTGAPTAFNQKPVAAAKPEPAPAPKVTTAPAADVAAKPAPDAEVRANTNAAAPATTVTEAQSNTALPAPKTVDTQALQSSEPTEPKSLPLPDLKAAPEKPQPVAEPVTENMSDGATESATGSVTGPVASAPITAPTASTAVAEAQSGQSKGFFGSLKELVFGEDEKEATDEAESQNTNLANAPTPAIERPTPAAPKPVEVVVPVDGLTIDEKLEMAQLSFEVEQYQQALNIWAPLAQKGNSIAQYNLGLMFNEGYAVPVDRVKAYFWWQKAKLNGSKVAATSLEQLETTLTFIEKERLKQLN